MARTATKEDTRRMMRAALPELRLQFEGEDPKEATRMEQQLASEAQERAATRASAETRRFDSEELMAALHALDRLDALQKAAAARHVGKDRAQ